MIKYIRSLVLFLFTLICLTASLTSCSKAYSPQYSDNNLIEHLNESTVMLVQVGAFGSRPYCGGVWINKNHILTAKHCVADENDEFTLNYEIKFQTYQNYTGQFPYNDSYETYNGYVVVLSDYADLAVIRTEPNIEHDIIRIYGSTVRTGMPVHTVGHPVGLSYNYTTGMLSQIREMKVNITDLENVRHYSLHITTSATFGSSGSGVFSNDGSLLGIASFVKSNMPGAAFYVHRDLIVKTLDENHIKYYATE